LAEASSAQARQYSLTEIPLGEFDALSAGRINDLGQVAGLRAMNQPERPYNGYVWSRGTGLVDLGIGPAAYAINNNGVAVGVRWTPEDANRAFLWTAQGGVRLLSSLPGGAPFASADWSTAVDINQRGQIIGVIGVPGEGYSYIREPNGSLRRLPVPSNTNFSPPPMALSLNDRGDVVGQVWFSEGRMHAFLWPAAGGYRDFGDLPGGLELSTAVGINNRGQIIGDALVPPDPRFPGTAGQRAVRFFEDGTIRELGALPGMADSSASDINEFGDIVGRSWGNPAGEERAVLWTDQEGPLNLNDFLDESGRGWTLLAGNTINNLGQIVVRGEFQGRTTYVVLTPIPEPSAPLAMLLLLPLMARQPSRIAPERRESRARHG